MTTTQIKQFTEYTQQYTQELQNIDYMVNNKIITVSEYRKLVNDAYFDYNNNLQKMGV